MGKVILSTDIPELKFFKKGKVRDIYELKDNLLIVATDRISAFDVILPNGIPGKGRVLTQISLYWFRQISSIIDNHLISSDVDAFPVLKKYRADLKDRIMVVKKARGLPVECVVRGYLSGSGWTEYQEKKSICGVCLPAGLKESDRLPEPIFTPSTKAEVGIHDENIGFAQVVKAVGKELAEKVRDVSLKIYSRATELAEARGIIIADTKFEFGMSDGKLILIDEVLTPDSSRFWPKDTYKPGGPQPSFDKQFVRDYLISINFNRKPPAPVLPDEIVMKTSEKYLDALKRLTT